MRAEEGGHAHMIATKTDILSLFCRPPSFYLPFAFTMIHKSLEDWRIFHRYSDSMHYCERKGKIKLGKPGAEARHSQGQELCQGVEAWL